MLDSYISFWRNFISSLTLFFSQSLIMSLSPYIKPKYILLHAYIASHHCRRSYFCSFSVFFLLTCFLVLYICVLCLHCRLQRLQIRKVLNSLFFFVHLFRFLILLEKDCPFLSFSLPLRPPPLHFTTSSFPYHPLPLFHHFLSSFFPLLLSQ